MKKFYTGINMKNNKILNCDTIVSKLDDFTEDEIYAMFDLTKEEVETLVALINDNIISDSKLWSSKKTNDEIQLAIEESKDYSKELLSKISTITLEYTTDLASITSPSQSTMYILEKADGTGDIVHILYLYNSDDQWIEVGDLESNLSYDNIYTKDKTDELLDKKANTSDVVKYDDIETDYTKIDITNTQVMGALATKTEFDNLNAKIDSFMNPSKLLCTITYDSSLLRYPICQLLYYKNLEGYGIGSYSNVLYGGANYVRYNPYLYTLEYVEDNKINIYVADELYFENPTIIQSDNYYVITSENSEISMTVRLMKGE